MDSIKIEKLRGQENFDVWKLRISSLLVEKETSNAIKNDIIVSNAIDTKTLATIRLNIADGSLLQIQNIETALEAWNALENLYSLKGFSSEYLIYKEFFNTKLSKHNSIEEYLNKIKKLVDQLRSKNISLPKEIICSWVLNNLDHSYDGFITIITQSYRNNTLEMDLDNLFSHLLDESRRQADQEKEVVLFNQTWKNNRQKKLDARRNLLSSSRKGLEGKFCMKCGKKGHNRSSCWVLHPELKPNRSKATVLKQKGYRISKPSYNNSLETPREEEIAVIAKKVEST
jgi:hypothetical protein